MHRLLPLVLAALLATLLAATAAPERRELFLVRSPDGQVSAIRAASFEQQGAILIIISEQGSRAVVQTRGVIARLPWYSDADLEGGEVDLAKLAATYRSYGPLVPSQRTFLESEARRFDEMTRARKQAADAAARAAEQRVADATATTYDPARAYSAEELRALLAAADAVRAGQPASADRLDAWSAPFRGHLARLEAGDQLVDGAWLTRDDLARRAQADREAAFAATLDYPFDAVALPGELLARTLRPLLLGAGAAMLVGLAVVFVGRRRAPTRVIGLILLIVPPLALSLLYYLASRDPAELPRGDHPVNDQPLIAAMSEAAGVLPGQTPTTRTISDQALNSLIARRARFTGDPPADAVVREGLVARVWPGRAAIFELLRAAGNRFIVRYDLTLAPTGASVRGVTLGALPLPADIATALWKSLEPALVGNLQKTGLAAAFTLSVPLPGGIMLTPISAAEAPAASTPTSAPEPSPSPEPTPESTPEIAATPEPTPTPPPEPTPAPATPEPTATPPPAPQPTPTPENTDPTANPFA